MLGDKIKFLRKKSNLNQQELAEKLKITRSHISSIEINRVKPSYELLVKMAEFFKVSLNYFYETENPKEIFKQALEIDDLETLKRFDIFNNGQKMTDEQKTQLINYARFLMSQSHNKNK